MTRLLSINRWSGAGVGLLLLMLATLAASAADPKRVLVLNPYGREVVPFSTGISAFRTTLARELGEPLDFYEVPLDLARLAETQGESSLVTFLEDRIQDSPVDLVVPIGGPGVQFAVRHRERLFADTPVLVIGGDPRFVPPAFLGTNATLVTQKADLLGMVEDILELQPQTTNIAVVFGASAMERYWVNECRREFQAFTNRVGFTWLNDLPLEQIVERCAALPPRSFILHGLFVVDADGVPCEKNEALRRLREVANAPLFGYFASEFGQGPIGGRLYQDLEIGTQGARLAIRILRGESPGDIPPQLLEAATPVYDWRELRRWGISETRLSAGSVIQFREPDFWEQYRWPIMGTVSFVLLQTGLIAGLVINRSKRRQGEAEATLIADISTKFVNLPASEMDREIVDAQRRICEFLGFDISALWQWSDEAMGSLTLSHLYRAEDGPPAPERMAASEYFPWCQQQLLAGRTIAVSSLDDLPAEAARDRETWRHFGIKTTLTIPLSVGGEPPFGTLSFNTTRAERDWPDALVKRLQLVAQIFANALARKRADQALREGEERMTLAAEAAAFGVWVWNLADNKVWGSERWLRLFGFAAGENISLETVLQRVHPDDRETVAREVRGAVANRNNYTGEFRVVLPNGTQRWVVSQGRCYGNAHGTPTRMLGAAIDITERKRTEDSLRGSEARLAAGTELAGLGYYEVDHGEPSCFTDERFNEICGVPAGRQPGLQTLEFWLEHLHPDDRPQLLDERQKLHEGKVEHLSMEYRYLHPTQGQKWVHHLVRVAARDAGGRVVRTFGVLRDITQEKRAQQESQELRDNLAHAGRVTVLGQLASALAHELSQPLGAILRNAEAAEILLQEATPDLEELRAIVTDILSDDQRAGQVIDRLRSLLKRRNLDLQPIELPGVIAEVLTLVRADAAARQVQLAYSTAPDLPLVRGDRIQLQQVLLNLLVNAMDAMDGCAPDQRSIQVNAHQTEPATVEVRVHDNGPGIPGGSPERLFEPFFTTKARGLGMGLAVSKTLIEAHQGKIWAENRPEGGACFCFTLPVASGEGQVAGGK